MKNILDNGTMTVFLTGHIDSSNAPATEKEIMDILAGSSHTALVLDLKDLEYISSAGLRIILKLKKLNKNLSAINVSSEVYDILEVTGFTELLDVSKAMREISIDDCEVVGEGANGIVYRIGSDTIVKVYKAPDSLDDIRHERELSRTAFVLGIPTAISYDVVKVGDRYGAVFELLNAKSLDELMRESADNLEYVASKTVEVAKIIHTTPAPAILPDAFDTVNGWLEDIKGYLTDEEYSKFSELIAALPRTGMMIHGDYHIKNLMQQGDETLLIDMDTLSKGHPIFELGYMFNAYKGFGLVDSSVVENFMGFSIDLTYRLWRRMLELYLGSDDASVLDSVEDKAALIGYLRLLRRKRGDSEKDMVFGKACQQQIKALLAKVDTLDF